MSDIEKSLRKLRERLKCLSTPLGQVVNEGTQGEVLELERKIIALEQCMVDIQTLRKIILENAEDMSHSTWRLNVSNNEKDD